MEGFEMENLRAGPSPNPLQIRPSEVWIQLVMGVNARPPCSLLPSKAILERGDNVWRCCSSLDIPTVTRKHGETAPRPSSSIPQSLLPGYNGLPTDVMTPS